MFEGGVNDLLRVGYNHTMSIAQPFREMLLNLIAVNQLTVECARAICGGGTNKNFLPW